MIIISTKIIKICGESLPVPLRIVFEQKEGKFSEIWKKANVVLLQKIEDKNFLKNYCTISLLSICSKIFERVIYNSLFNHFQNNKLFTPSQSGFLHGDSCIAQLLSIIHEIQTVFDTSATVDTRGVFLDIVKAIDNVWHSGLLFKLEAYGVEGELLASFKDFLDNRKQRVVLNGQMSDWSTTRVSTRTSITFNFHK